MEEVWTHLAEENRAEWERLLRLLQHPTPRVFWVTCDTDLVWLQMIPALKEALPEYEHREIRVDGESASLYHAVEDLGLGTEKVIIHVLGITTAVENGVFLRNLNLEREPLFRSAPGHIIIWGSQPAANIIATRAADWWSWMAFIFPFHTPGELLSGKQKALQLQFQFGSRKFNLESKEPNDRIRHLRQQWEDFLESSKDILSTQAVAEELADIAIALSSEYLQEQQFFQAIETIRQLLLVAREGLSEAKKLLLQNNLAVILLYHNEPIDSEKLLRPALEKCEKLYGSDSLMTATTLNNLGHVLATRERFLEAEAFIRRGLDILERLFPYERAKLAASSLNLAQVLMQTNRSDQAESLMQRTLDLDEQSFGKDHPEIASDLNHLAELYKNTGRLSEAAALLQRAILNSSRNSGDHHPSTKLFIENYRHILSAMNQTESEINLQLDNILSS